MSDRLEAALAELAAAIREEIQATDARAAGGPEQLYSVDEAAGLLGIGRTALYGEIQASRLRSVKVGRRRLVPASAVGAYSAQTTPPAIGAPGGVTEVRRAQRDERPGPQ